MQSSCRPAIWSKRSTMQQPSSAMNQPRTAIWSNRASAIAALVILLAAFGLRVVNLGHVEIGGDEAFSYALMSRSFDEIVNITYRLQEPHPVGGYFIQHIGIGLFGDSEFSIRFISVLFGMLAIALIAAFARQMRLGRNSTRKHAQDVIALVAMGLMAIHPLTVYHSRWGRMYAISLAVTIASTILAVMLIRRPTWKRFVAYVAVTWLALNVHYFAGYIIIAQNLYAFIVLGAHMLGARTLGARTLADGSRRGQSAALRKLLIWIAAEGLTAALFFPWFWLMRRIIFGYSGTSYSPSWDQFVNATTDALFTNTLPPVWAWVLMVAALVLTWFVVWRRANPSANAAPRTSRIQLESILLLVLYFVTPLAMVWYGSRTKATFTPRYLIAALPPLMVLQAALIAPVILWFRTGFNTRWRSFATLVPSVVVLIALVAGQSTQLFNYYADHFGRTPNWRNVIAVFDRYQGGFPVEQSRVAVTYPDPAIEYYYRRTPPAIIIPNRYGDAASADAIVNELMTNDVRRVTLQIVDGGWNTGDLAQHALARHFTKIEEWYSGRWIVQVYGRIDDALLQPVGAVFSDTAELQSAYVYPDPKGHLIEVHLRWAGDASQFSGTEKIFVHAVNLATPGQLDGQLEIELTPALLDGKTHSYGMRLPENFAPGEYRVYAGIYDPALPGLPRLLTQQGQDTVELARVALQP